MKRIFGYLSLLTGFILFFSCDSGEGDCQKNWYVSLRNPSAIVEIDTINDELSMQMENPSGVDAETYQRTVSGDFNFRIDFRNFARPNLTDDISYAALVLYDPTVPDTILDTSIVMAGIMNGKLFAVATVSDTVYTNTNGDKGIFNVRRTGNMITVKSISGFDTAVIERVYKAQPSRVGFRIGTLDSSVAASGMLGIKITNFEVITGANQGLNPIVSDDFKCNSLGKKD